MFCVSGVWRFLDEVHFEVEELRPRHLCLTHQVGHSHTSDRDVAVLRAWLLKSGTNIVITVEPPTGALRFEPLTAVPVVCTHSGRVQGSGAHNLHNLGFRVWRMLNADPTPCCNLGATNLH